MPNYDEMPAGREMDALVAKKIFGKVRCQARCHKRGVRGSMDGTYCYAQPDSPAQGANIPHYSTDISAAWEVVEKIRSSSGLSVIVEASVHPNEYICAIGAHHRGQWIESFRSAEAEAPLVICRAALKAVDR